MEQFVVPQFIEREPKIVGPLTFKQFVYIGTAGAIAFFLYFTVSFSLFIILSIILVGVAISLAFIKVGNQTLPIIIKNFFFYIISGKVYLWKTASPKIITKKRAELSKEEPKEKSELPVAGESRLRDLSTKLQTRQR